MIRRVRNRERNAAPSVNSSLDNDSKKRKLRVNVKLLSAALILSMFFLYNIMHLDLYNIMLVKSDYRYLRYITTVSRSKKPPRPISSTKNPIFFLHIGKTGGSSMGSLCYHLMKRLGRTCAIEPKHFDWSYIEQKGNPDTNVDVMTWLREPVSRAVSQFHFSKHQSWAIESNATFIHQTLDEYIDHPGWFRQPINDGEASLQIMSGITGTNVGWIATDGKDSYMKRFLRADITENLKRCARNLDSTVWFGLLEDIPRSMKMLQWTLGLNEQPSLPNLNMNGGNTNRNLTVATDEKLRSYIPCEIWLYEYAKRLFEARWNHYNGKDYEHPEYPSMLECQHSKSKGF